MTKIARGKTETIKQRSLYIYLPTVEMAEDWKQRAEKERKSISRFIVMRVLESVAPEGEEGERALRAELAKDLGKVQEEKKGILEENEQLRQENRMLKMLSDNLDRELKRYRAAPFLEPGFSGIRRFDKELIELLKKGKGLEADQILRRLGIEITDSELVKAVREQLEALLAYDLLEYDGRWWKWKAQQQQ